MFNKISPFFKCRVYSLTLTAKYEKIIFSFEKTKIAVQGKDDSIQIQKTACSKYAVGK